jgi:hypothetical protein
MLPCFGREHYRLSVTDSCQWRDDHRTSVRFRIPVSVVNIAHFQKLNEIGATPRSLHQLTPFASCPILDAQQLVETMKKILLSDSWRYHARPYAPAAARVGTHHHCDENRTSKVPF